MATSLAIATLVSLQRIRIKKNINIKSHQQDNNNAQAT